MLEEVVPSNSSNGFLITRGNMLSPELVTTVLVLRMSQREYCKWAHAPCLLMQQFQDPSCTPIDVVFHVFTTLLKAFRTTAKQLKAQANLIRSKEAVGAYVSTTRVKLAFSLLQNELGLVREIRYNLKRDLNDVIHDMALGSSSEELN